MKVNGGQDLQAKALTGGAVGFVGTASAATATSLTSSGFTASAYVGQVVVVASATTKAYGVILSNTTTVLTVDQWNSPASPGTVATTPGATDNFVIMPGAAFVQYMAITGTNITPSATDTALSGELTTNGLGRKAAAYAHTVGANTYTLTSTYTYTGSSAQNIYGIGTFNTPVASSGIMLHESTFTVATVNASGDAVTVTQTVTM
jgi:hypothetical protein